MKGQKFFLAILGHKVAILLVIFVLSGIGLAVSSSIPRGVLPNVFFPRIEVSIENGYMPIQQMLFSITKPSEEALKTVQNVQKIVSNTSVGSTDISLYFNWDIDPYLAYQLVQARIADIKNRIPNDAQITIRQATPSMYPVAIYSIGSDTLSRAQLSEKLYYELKPIFLSIDGVYDIEMKAPEWSEYQLLFDAQKMRNYNLDIQTIIDRLKAQNLIDFMGLIEDYHKQYILSLYQKNQQSEKLLDMSISLSDGRSVKLSEIALLIKKEAPTKALSASKDFKNSVVFDLLRQPNANEVDVAKKFNEKLEQLAPELQKEHIQIKASYDGTDFVSKAIQSVSDAIILGGVIAVLIVFFFLRKLKLSLISLFIIPITFLITILGMKLVHIDLNIFSLAGMAAALGGLIDQMIIVIENIERRFKEGVSKKEAVIEGSKEILPVMSVATFLAILIFAPLLLVSGVVGLFFKQLAFVLVVTYFVSQIIAIFLTPIIAYIALPEHESEKPDFLEPLIAKYKKFLSKSMRVSWISIPIILGSLGVSWYLFTTIPSTFLPKWDEGNIVVDLTLPPGTSLEQSHDEFMAVSKIINETPEVQSWTMRIGTGLGVVSTQVNVGDFLVVLKPNHAKSSFQIIEELRKQIESKVPNLEELGLSQVLEDRLGDIMGADAPISVMLYGTHPDTLIQTGYKLKESLKTIKDIDEVSVLTSYASPSINVRLKSDAPSIYGIDENSLLTQIRAMYYGEIVASIAEGEKLINIRVLMDRPREDPIAYLQKEMLIYSSTLHKSIPLSEIAEISYQDKVSEITHYNLSPVCVLGVRFNGNDMSSAVNEIQKKIDGFNLPSGITSDIGGLYKEQQKSFTQMSYVIVFAIVIIFIGLMFHFNDLRIALNILVALIVTLTGVLIALKFTAKPLDITAFMGMLIVLSIVINNNVLIYDFYQKNKENFNTIQDAILHAISMRIRPVLMTMLSNAFALLPVALAIGTGTQIIQDLAIAIMGGLFFAIVVNLYVMPLFFYLMLPKE